MPNSKLTLPFLADSQAYWDVGDIDSITESLGAISQVNDQIGTHHLTQATPAHRLSLENRDGRYVAYSPDDERSLDIPASLVIDHRSFTLVMAMQLADSGVMGTSARYGIPVKLASGNYYILAGQIVGKWSIVYGTVNEGPYLSNSPVLMILRGSASTLRLTIDRESSIDMAALPAGNSNGGIIFNYSNDSLGCQYADFRGAAIYDRALTDSEMESVLAWSAAQWGCGAKKTVTVICDGDSNMEGGWNSGNNDTNSKIYSPASQIARRRPDWNVFGYAIGGDNTQNNIDDMASNARVIAAASTLPVVAVLSNGNGSATYTESELQEKFTTYLVNMATDGAHTVVATIPVRITAGFDAIASSLSYWMAINYSDFADALADIRSIPELSDANDTGYFSVDGVHRNENGYALETGVFIAAIETALATSTGGSGVTAGEVATAVRAELATELAYLDAPVSSASSSRDLPLRPT